MTTATILGDKWIIARSTWDKDYIDLVVPRLIIFAAFAKGEMAFGATAALRKSKWRCQLRLGSDEGDQVSGRSLAELSGSDA